MRKHFNKKLMGKVLKLRKIEEKFFSIIEENEIMTQDTSHFDFINQNEMKDNETMLFDQSGNILKMNEICEYEMTDDLKNVYQGISNLTKLIKEMNCCVFEQGALVDRIDINVKIALEQTK